MILVRETPTKLRLAGATPAEMDMIRLHLAYVDKRIEQEAARLRRGALWFVKRNGEEAYKAELARLKEAKHKSLLFKDDLGDYTYPGLLGLLRDRFPDASYEDQVELPEPQLLARKVQPKVDPRQYQPEAARALVEAGHGAVEIGTGLGKSHIIALVIKALGLRTVVMTPSASIARQMFDQLTELFGKMNVGLYGDGRKDLGKLVTVGIAQSLANVEEGTAAWAHLSAAQVFIPDESHMCPADTLESVCCGLMAAAPYRLFFSATQMRADGRDLVLRGIIGPVVYRMTVKDGVDQGYLARPRFRMIQLSSGVSYNGGDPNEMTRRHLFYNKRVAKVAGDIATKMVADKRQVLVLVDEVAQLATLLPHLPGPVAFAHGGLSKDNVGKVPAAFKDSDPNELVRQFNEGKVAVLVGTSCISIGTDVRTVGATINLQGGMSEVQVRQGAVGRSTRGGPLGNVKLPWRGGELKEDCLIFDFDVMLPQDHSGDRLSPTHRHALERAKVYEETYPDVEWMDLT